MKNDIILYEDEKKCCGCNACMSICYRKAIVIQEDQYGFKYPIIDITKCVRCKRCMGVCQFIEKIEMNTVLQSYAAALKEDEVLKKSSSGGIFSSLASNVLDKGGVVFGASMYLHQDKLMVQHIGVENKKKLYLLQGSKYVQSDINDSYIKAKENLDLGRKVLFSGTPCQIAGLKCYLGKEYENLITVDVICHGVPNQRLFQDYISYIQEIYKIKVKSYAFRDKTKGQGMYVKLSIIQQDEKTKDIYIDAYSSFYFALFLEKAIYRKSCYNCPYARVDRVSDITLGDYWGFYKEHFKDLKTTSLSNLKGISCVLVNSRKGEKIFFNIKNELVFLKTSLEKISRNNMQLYSASKMNTERKKILDLYYLKGIQAVDEYCKRKYWLKRYKNKIKHLIPKKIRNKINIIIAMSMLDKQKEEEGK